jgi:hypothetical protein
VTLGRRKLLLPCGSAGRQRHPPPAAASLSSEEWFVTEIPPRRAPPTEPKICHTPHTLTILVVHAHAGFRKATLHWPCLHTHRHATIWFLCKHTTCLVAYRIPWATEARVTEVWTSVSIVLQTIAKSWLMSRCRC